LNIFNDGKKGRLNENVSTETPPSRVSTSSRLTLQCGADYVKLYQKAPDGIPLAKYPKYCSIDGDADRLIYFFNDHKNQFRLLDGDRFSVLFASFLSIKLKEANLFDDTKIGVIQTAYANGSSTDYLVRKMVTIAGGKLI
jgi:phosphoacetylglucosamine mutase